MELDRWKQIERLYHAALECEAEAREAFLDEACAGDEDLRREVAGLLACDVPSDSFIQSPAIEMAAWAKSISRSTPGSAARSPSNCCSTNLRQTPSASGASSRKRARPRRSTTRTSSRSTKSAKSKGGDSSSPSMAKGKHCASGWRARRSDGSG